MNYNLAKQLKDAGFPQNGLGRTLTHPGWQEMPKEEWEPTNAYAPTLEELIEACGDKLVSTYNTGSEWQLNEEAGSETPQVKGTTLKIAVARLWLALNKHD